MTAAPEKTYSYLDIWSLVVAQCWAAATALSHPVVVRGHSPAQHTVQQPKGIWQLREKQTYLLSLWCDFNCDRAGVKKCLESWQMWVVRMRQGTCRMRPCGARGPWRRSRESGGEMQRRTAGEDTCRDWACPEPQLGAKRHWLGGGHRAA